MKKNMRNSKILLLIVVIVLSLSAVTVSARDDRISKSDVSTEEREVEEPLLIAQNPNIEIVRENGEGGEEEIIPFISIENDRENTEDGYQDPLVILGNQASKDGSNDFTNIPKLPVLIILTVIGLLAIIMVCIIRKK